MSKRHIFWGISAVVVLGGMFFAWDQLKFDTSKILDIEFIGGTSVQVGVKDQKITDEQLADAITGKDINDKTKAPGWLVYASDQLAKANVTQLDESRYVINTPDRLTTPQLEACLVSNLPKQTDLSDLIVRGGIKPAEGGGVQVQLNPDLPGAVKTVDGMKDLLGKTSQYVRNAADRLRGIRVQLVKEDTASGQSRNAFEIVTTETNKRLVAEAILVPTRDLLDVTQPIEAKLASDPTRALKACSRSSRRTTRWPTCSGPRTRAASPSRAWPSTRAACCWSSTTSARR
jgi:hypothetical protein